MYLVLPQDDAHIVVARELFLEYADWLGFDLCFQNFDEELTALPGYYAPPSGRLYLMKCDDAWAGCVGLRAFGDAGACEMKRLYIRPAFRGRHLGRMLAVKVIEDARQISYRCIYLDTIGNMTQAITLYESLGFQRVAPYRHNPCEDAVYLRLELNPNV